MIITETNDLSVPKIEGVFLASYKYPNGCYGSDIPTDEYLHVNECGYSEAVKNDLLCQRLPRKDFEMFYIVNGSVAFFFGQKKIIASAGQIVILKPGDPHNFVHYSSEKTKSLWIHFAGVGAIDFLKGLNLWNDTVYKVGINSELKAIFSKVFQEIRFNRPNYEKMTEGLLMQFLTIASRLLQTNSNAFNSYNLEQLNPAIDDMYNNFYSHRTNDDYAKMCNLSVSHFINLFKQRMGVPPLVFRQNIRMEKAKDLLITTNHPIKEIAFMAGYSDTLYFSRIFRKKNGMPPGEYRKKNSSVISETE